MSVCVTIRCDVDFTPKDVFKHLADSGDKILVTSDEFPCVKFGVMGESLRGIELNKQENGIEVRVCAYATLADYELFAKVIKLLMEMTGGKAFLYDDDDDEVVDPLSRFDADWAETERESSFCVCRALSNHNGSPIIMDGMFLRFCVGPTMYAGFDIPLSGKYKKKYIDDLQRHLTSVQWYFAHKTDTGTRIAISSPGDSEERKLTVSLISIDGDAVSDFDYISYADLFCVMDNKNDRYVLIPFKEMWKILPPDVFQPIDEYQFERVGELTADMAREMIEKGQLYQPADLGYVPTNPGDGYDERQNTFILMWNPAISSVTMDDHLEGISAMLVRAFNWSVWEHEKAKCCDRFFLVRVGEGKTGIVMSGVFDSHPYQAEDWSGRGRPTYYMDMRPNVILDPENSPMITTGELMKAIPTFDWTGGHSGRMLNAEEAMSLEKLWHEFLSKHENDADGIKMNMIH